MCVIKQSKQTVVNIGDNFEQLNLIDLIRSTPENKINHEDLTEDDLWFLQNNYSAYRAGIKTGFGEKLLIHLATTQPRYLKCKKRWGKIYFDKKLIDDMASGAPSFGQRRQILDEFKVLMKEHTFSSDLAITIALRNQNVKLDLLSMQCYLDKCLCALSRKLYGRKWKSKGLKVSFVGCAENRYEKNLHWHGIIKLPEQINNLQGRPSLEWLLEDLLTKYIVREYKRSSVVVANLTDIKGWINYCTKDTASYRDSRSDELFEDMLDHFILI